MRIIGVDPGSRRTGWGVIDSEGNKRTHVAHGAIVADERLPLHERLLIIENGLGEVLEAHTPDHMAVESIFFAKFANAALKLGHARGVVLVNAARRGLSVHEYPPAVIKRSLVGSGRGSKDQVQQIVLAILQLRPIASEDAADALAIALTHALCIGSPLAALVSKK